MAPLLESTLLPVHLAYFFLSALIGSAILYTTSARIVDLPYVDAFFMSFSAMTGAGLSVVDPSVLGTIPQIVLFILFILGHSVPIHGIITLSRAMCLRKTLIQGANTGEGYQTKCQGSSDEKHGTSALNCGIVNPEKVLHPLKTNVTDREIPADEPSPVGSEDMRYSRGPLIFTFTSCVNGKSTRQVLERQKNKAINLRSLYTLARSRLEILLSRNENVDRDSGSAKSSEDDWHEYRALMVISVSTLLYAVICPLIGILVVGFWFKLCRPDVPQGDGVAPFWAGSFLVMSSFANNGMSLIDSNMEPFQREAIPLLICGSLILAGNTLFPCVLRLLIWSTRRMLPDTSKWEIWRRAFDNVLTEPQTLCGFLFPAGHTWFLVGTVVVLNSIMWGGFELAALRDIEIEAIPRGYRALDGLYQAFSVRGGGFAVVNIDKLPQALLVIYAIMMYLSALPTCAAFRSAFLSHPEARSLSCLEAGTKTLNSETSVYRGPVRSWSVFYYARLRSHLSRDMWWLSFAVILICVAESQNFAEYPLAFSTFNILFEVVSAYSFVGVSVGYPGKTTAFCAEWSPFSKLLLVLIAVIGRHRDVPNMVIRRNRLAQVDGQLHATSVVPQTMIESFPIDTRQD
ncbi:Uncharacterized protein PECH_001152 [Penicillium ucsense]|uniref:Cation transporter n=1 Tax=Penicillium ucsense TaxID=2839758 RepID=A0A8J8WNC5_9EURO|nr:Uncharacterized protein PECM_000053 [Penicillium ucsense]KAF7733102.1 Uncharacterized protein PECH_001152 [Penicillium ucsense]